MTKRTGNRPGRPTVIERPHSVSVRMSRDLYEALRVHSYHQHVSVAEVVRTAAADWVRRNPPKPV